MEASISTNLAVQGANVGMLIEVEAKAIRVEKGSGNWTVTGVIDQEEVGGEGRKLIRKSMARGAVENVLTVLRSEYGLEILDYDLHLNFPGGIPVDGPSAGVSIATAIYSAITQKPIYHLLAMTGEVSVHGKVKAVGGVMTKVDAARKAGIKKVIIPSDNWLSIFENLADIEVIAVKELGQVLDIAFVQ
jgi:Lon-like ATP-dependent protease